MKMQKITLRSIHFYLNDKDITEDNQILILIKYK